MGPLCRWTLLALVALVSPGDARSRTTWDDGCEIDLSLNIVCYYTNWAQYRPGVGAYTVANIDPCLCTHIVFAFANVSDNALGPLEKNDLEMYKELSDLKQINWDLKTLLSIGGEAMGTKEFAKIIKTEQSRRTFAVNSLSYLKEHRFDGIDVDWEYPAKEHKENFTKLLEELRHVFHDDALRSNTAEKLIACALGAGLQYIEDSYDIPAIAKLLDFANVMTYDLHGGWDPVTGFHSALEPFERGDAFCQRWVVDEYLYRGMPAEKIMLGIPTYGRTFTLCNESNTEPRDCSEWHGAPGPQTQINGTLAYYEICRRPGLTTVLDPVQNMTYGYKDDLWIGYDDVASVQRKKEYLLEWGLGGVIFWDLSTDDFSDMCGGGAYTLIKVFDPNGAPRSKFTSSVLLLGIVVTWLLSL